MGEGPWSHNSSLCTPLALQAALPGLSILESISTPHSLTGICFLFHINYANAETLTGTTKLTWNTPKRPLKAQKNCPETPLNKVLRQEKKAEGKPGSTSRADTVCPTRSGWQEAHKPSLAWPFQGGVNQWKACVAGWIEPRFSSQNGQVQKCPMSLLC